VGSADKPTQRKRDRNGRIRAILDRVANDILKRGRRPQGAIGRAARGVFSLAVQIFRRALSLVDDAFDLAPGIAGNAAKALLDLAANVPGCASYPMFVHTMLLFALSFARKHQQTKTTGTTEFNLRERLYRYGAKRNNKPCEE
jgi:hypothetical protein